MTTHHHDVIIVGGGPVGCGLAIELGGRGVSCALVERHESPQLIPKGQNLTQRTMEHFASWGVEDEVRAARLAPPGQPIDGVVAFETLLGDYSYPWYRRDVVGSFYSRANERLPQYETERVLRRRVAAMSSVETLVGWSAEQVSQSATGVAVEAAAGSGERRLLEGSYLVGCDGSGSTVRRQAGITETRSSHDRRMMLLVFRSRELHRLLDERFGATSFFNVLDPALDGYWRFLGHVDYREQWFFHAPVANDATAEPHDLVDLLHATVGARFPVDFDYIGFWDLRIAVADTYRTGRVFIAGDAAHSHPPYGGFGVNTGFEDARNLGWKLAGTLLGWGSDQLLDSYTSERRPVFQSTAREFIEASILRDRDFVARWNPATDGDGFRRAWEERGRMGNVEIFDFEPNYEGSPIVLGPDGGLPSARGVHRSEARAGHHLAPWLLPAGTDVSDQIGKAFTLLALDADADDVAAFATAAGDLSIPMQVIRDDRPEAAAYYSTRLVLVRPDQFVSWIGDGIAADPRTALARSVGRVEPI